MTLNLDFSTIALLFGVVWLVIGWMQRQNRKRWDIHAQNGIVNAEKIASQNIIINSQKTGGTHGNTSKKPGGITHCSTHVTAQGGTNSLVEKSIWKPWLALHHFWFKPPIYRAK